MKEEPTGVPINRATRFENKQTVLEENLSNSKDELEENYEVGDEDEDDEEGRAIVTLQTSSNQPTNQHSGDVPPFMQAAMQALYLRTNIPSVFHPLCLQ
ncbi:hypothetical protein PIB30_098594 [Stylosanthes scabra]|uniref:Uncharacterized protein n=1 Tax=Stylosanthes scabra TaxID=79078 RepID=A0ABU6RX29_9FABA|nr:hypothetical protein [Stylosanthes scabra]